MFKNSPFFGIAKSYTIACFKRRCGRGKISLNYIFKKVVFEISEFISSSEDLNVDMILVELLHRESRIENMALTSYNEFVNLFIDSLEKDLYDEFQFFIKNNDRCKMAGREPILFSGEYFTAMSAYSVFKYNIDLPDDEIPRNNDDYDKRMQEYLDDNKPFTGFIGDPGDKYFWLCYGDSVIKKLGGSIINKADRLRNLLGLAHRKKGILFYSIKFSKAFLVQEGFKCCHPTIFDSGRWYFININSSIHHGHTLDLEDLIPGVEEVICENFLWPEGLKPERLGETNNDPPTAEWKGGNYKKYLKRLKSSKYFKIP